MTRSITITPVLNGYIVNVGCQRVVFTDAVDLTNRLLAYCRDSELFEKEFLKTCVNRELLRCLPVEAQKPANRVTQDSGELSTERAIQSLNQTLDTIPSQAGTQISPMHTFQETPAPSTR